MSELELCLCLDGRAESADPLIQHLESAGVDFFTLADKKDTIESRERLYRLVREGVLDTPGFVGQFETLEEFNERIFMQSYWSHRESQFLAGAGNEWIGLSSLTSKDERQAEFGLTVVSREWRGRCIARALKVRAIEYARSAGVRCIRTRNHVDNTQILALNRSLGFSSRE